MAARILITFAGHPRLGEFILHEDWPEGMAPMRRAFDARRRLGSAAIAETVMNRRAAGAG